MTVLYPGAEHRPLGPQTQPLMKSHDIICLHTMVGRLASTDAMFKANGYGGTESHFGVGHSGLVYQWQDLDRTADANGPDGNHRCISIETADYDEGPFGRWNTSGDNVPAWTPAQVEAIARIVAWCCARYNIPCSLVPDSRPGRRGVAFHRQGVPGYAVTGGERWSTARGKVCPGAKRIAQVPQVIERARQLMGSPAVTSNTGAELNAEETKMLKDIHAKTVGTTLPLTGRPGPEKDDMYGHVLNADALGRSTAERLTKIEERQAKIDQKLSDILDKLSD